MTTKPAWERPSTTVYGRIASKVWNEAQLEGDIEAAHALYRAYDAIKEAERLALAAGTISGEDA